MSKFLSYIKSVLPSEKAIRKLPHWQNLLALSPKNQSDISGVVIPKVGANRWSSNNADLAYLQKMYDCHDLVYSCIDLVSSTFALANLRIKKLDLNTQKYNYVPDHPLQLILDNPNNSMAGYDLRQSYIVHRLLFGTSASILIRNSMISSFEESNRCPTCLQFENSECPHVLWHFNSGPITQIMPVHLDRLSKVVVEFNNRNVELFAYDLGDGVKRIIHPNNIMTDPNYNPGGSFYGTSPTAIIQRWLEIDLGLSRQIGAYLMNNAIPSMILNIKPPKYSEGGKVEDPSTFLQDLKEKWIKDFSMNSYLQGGGQQVKTPAFVFGDIDILKVQDGIKDIVQKPLFSEIENRIARIYKVPRSFFEFGIEAGVDQNEENKNFFNYAIRPQLSSFKAKIDRYVLPTYNDPTLKTEWDLSELGISSFLEEKRKAHILKTWELGIVKRDEVRDSLQLDPIGGDLGDDLYRITVMSDGRGQYDTSQIDKLDPIDNRLKPNPQLSNQAYDKPLREPKVKKK